MHPAQTRSRTRFAERPRIVGNELRLEILVGVLGCGLAGKRYVGIVDWQQAASLGIVAATAVWMGWRLWRRRRGSGARAIGCGCRGGASAGRAGTIHYHARKGERPRVTIRFG